MRHLLLLIVALLCSTSSFAQIGDWIADQIKAEIEAEIEASISPIIHYNSNTLGYFGNYLWESIVSAKCESDLKTKAKEFETFNIDRSYLNGLSGKYKGTITWRNYSDICSYINARSNSYFHKSLNVGMSNVADSKIDRYAVAFIDSCTSASEITTLDRVLSKAVVDSLSVFADITGLRDSLLDDIKENATLAILLNNHPETVRVYCNSIGAPSLRTQPQHLYYWAVKAVSFRKKLPKNKNLTNPLRLTFAQTGKVVTIMDGNVVLGEIEGDVINVKDINLMNFPGCPNTTYIYANNRWTTDRWGHVISAEQTCGKELKKKCKQKSHIKAKEIGVLLGIDGASEKAYFNSPEYGAPEVLLNTFVYDKTKANKQAVNDGKKMVKTNLKNNTAYTSKTDVVYTDNGAKPAKVSVNKSMISSKVPSVDMVPTQPDANTVSAAVARNKTAPTRKTEIFKTSIHRAPVQQSNVKRADETPKYEASNTLKINGKAYRLEGKIGGKFPIVMELEANIDGSFSGRYAYRLTLRRNGDVACSWLSISSDSAAPQSKWTVRDCKHDQVEWWSNVRFDGRTLTARMKNKAGKYYDVTATVSGQ